MHPRNPDFERKHPRDPADGRFTDTPGGGWLSRLTAATGGLSDRDLTERERKVNDLVAANRHLDTNRVHRPNGRWTDERAAAHQAIVDRVWAEKAGQVPDQHLAVMTGGLAGAGKTTVLTNTAEINLGDYLVISADEMKDEIIRAGLVPTIPGHEDLTPMELSALYHVESAFLADMLAERAYAQGKNVIIDASMGNRSAPESRLARLREKGYRTRGIFVDIPVETSLERAAARYRWGMRQHEKGEGPGGRTIPPTFITAQRGEGGRTVNRQVFDDLAAGGAFDEWEIHDNSGDAPVRVAASRQQRRV